MGRESANAAPIHDSTTVSAARIEAQERAFANKRAIARISQRRLMSSDIQLYALRRRPVLRTDFVGWGRRAVSGESPEGERRMPRGAPIMSAG